MSLVAQVHPLTIFLTDTENFVGSSAIPARSCPGRVVQTCLTIVGSIWALCLRKTLIDVFKEDGGHLWVLSFLYGQCLYHSHTAPLTKPVQRTSQDPFRGDEGPLHRTSLDPFWEDRTLLEKTGGICGQCLYFTRTGDIVIFFHPVYGFFFTLSIPQPLQRLLRSTF